MNEETRAKIIQGVTICQRNLEHAWKPNEDFIILSGNTARHLESILELVLHAINEDKFTDIKTEEMGSKKHVEELYEKALDAFRNYDNKNERNFD